MIHFILGGARSGKSRFAEDTLLSLCKQHNKQPVYIATATALDAEMEKRISMHQQGRDDGWQLIESPLDLVATVNEMSTKEGYLIDCLTLWLNNIIYQYLSDNKDGINAQKVKDRSQINVDAVLSNRIDALVSSLQQCEHDIVLVSNEVGLGVVPLGESTRLFVDYCGWLNQAVATIADKVTLVTAGIPQTIKPVTQ